MANIITRPEEVMRAKYDKIERKRARKAKRRRGNRKGSPTVSGGLPSLGKRR